jgi:hypothetical protein
MFMKNLLSFIFAILLISPVSAISYTWNGSASSDWNTAANWTPVGIPGLGDDVIVFAATNNCVLDAPRTLLTLTVNSGVLDLNTNTLIVTANASFSAGNVDNGTLTVAAATTDVATLAGTVFGGTSILNVTSGRIILNGGQYGGPVILEQTGATNTGGTGNAVFNGSLVFTLSGAGYWRIAGNTVFNGAVTFINNGTNYILPELSAANTYNSTLSIQNNSSSNIRLAYNGATQYFGNIDISNTSTGSVLFCELATGSASLEAAAVINTGAGGINSGTVLLRRITQLNPTAINLNGGVNAELTITNCVWQGSVDFICGRLTTNGTIYNGPARLEKTSITADYSGGNTFNSSTNLVHSGSVNSFRFGRNNPDTYNGDVLIENYNNGHIRFADNTTGNVINGDLTVINNSTNWVYFCNEATSDLLVNGNIEFNSTGSSSGVSFGTNGNPITQAAGFNIAIGATGWDAGELIITSFIQLGASAVNLTLTGNGFFNSVNSDWAGNIAVVAPRIRSSLSDYLGTVSYEKTGGTDDVSGGNVFHQNTLLIHSGADDFRFGQTNPDVFHQELRARNNSTGAVFLAYNSAGNLFNGNVLFENITGNGVYVCENSGTATLANGFSFQVGALGFSNGQLRIRNTTQLGNTAQNIATIGTSRVILSDNSFDGAVAFSSERIFLSGNTFNSQADFIKNGAGDDASAGGNEFNGPTSLSLSGAGYLLMANVDPDIFNDDLSVVNTGTEYIYLSYNAAGNEFNGDVTFQSVGSLGVRIGVNGGISTLANGATLAVGALGFDAGELRFQNVTQLGNTSQNLTLTGTARLLSLESVWNGNISFESPRVYTRGTTYNGTALWHKTGSIDDGCAGINVFNQASQILNSSGSILYFSQTNPDIFNAPVSIRNTGTSTIRMADGSAGNQYNGDITLESVGSGGIFFGQNGGDATLANGFTVIVGALGFDSGELRFNKFTQLGNTAQNVTITGTGYLLNLESNWNGAVSFSAPRIFTRGTNYFSVALLEKTAISNDQSTGNNIFHGAATLRNTGSAYFGMGWTNPDIFNSTLLVQNSGTSQMYVAHNSSGNTITGNLTVENTSNGGIVYFNESATGDLTINGNIEINSSLSANGIRFGNQTLNPSFIQQAAGTSITIGAGGFHTGELRFVNFTKLGADPVSLTLTGTGYFLSFESVWNGNVQFTAPRMYTRGSVYNGTARLEKNGINADQSTGNNQFNMETLLVNSGSAYFGMGWTSPDSFNANLEVQTNGGSIVYLGYNSVGNAFNGNITVSSVAASGGVRFGQGGGSGTLAVGNTVSVGGAGFDSGELHFRNFTQTGATAQNITLTGTAIITLYDSDWGGNVTFISPQLFTRGTTYRNLAYLEKNGATNNASVGGNTFMQDTEFHVSGTGYFMPANTQANTFLADATYRKTGTGLMYPTYNVTSFYSGDINIQSNTAITFGANTNGRVYCTGGAAQSINDLGASPQPIFRQLTVDKTADDVTLNIPVTVSSDLNMMSGNLNTTSANLLWMSDNSSVSAVSNSSYVSGPVRKVGNDAFTFPIGKDGFYQPASISAPSNAAHHFTAEYFFQDPVTGGYPDAPMENPIVRISDCEYWIIDRTNGTSNVAVTLSYQNKGAGGCSGVVSQVDLVVARWDGSIWANHGNGGFTGIPGNGTVSSAAAVTSFSPFTLATLDAINPLPVELIYFTAVPNNEVSVQIDWATASEINTAYYHVERSENGTDWNFLSRSEAAGNSSQILHYQTIDNDPFIGISYYRLVQYDINMDTTIYGPVAVQFDGKDYWAIYPNPATDQIQFSSQDADMMQVYDISGRMVLQKNAVMGMNYLKIDHLVQGTYFVKKGSQVTSFVKN